MNRGFTFLLLLFGALLFSAPSLGQYSRYLVTLADKHQQSFTLDRPSDYLSSRAILRRSRHAIPIDSIDLPVSADYVQTIASIPGVEVLSSSKWLNKLLIRLSDPSSLNQVLALPFVRTSTPIALQRPPGTRDTGVFREALFPIRQREVRSGIRSPMGAAEVINYGNSEPQIHIHEGEYLHQRGFTGHSILIAVLDGGFQAYSSNIAFDSIRMNNQVLGGYDFVLNQPGIAEVHPHGSNCLSIIAANRPGIIVGSAPHANFLLLRTENDNEEFPIEEFFWARGAEYADSAGADIISSSLGYSTFDDGAFNHGYTDRDGNTCLSTIAADLAAAKGMIVCNSAGNSGGSSTDEKFVACPADGDSVLAVGAIQMNGIIAGFSSWGPNAAGKVKPNVVSVGQGTILANNAGDPVAGNGTSYSNPNIAGMVACLWDGFPEFKNMQIIDAVQRSADRFSNPDSRYGYGIPNFRAAYLALLQKRNEQNFDAILGTQWIKAFPNPFASTLNIFFKPVSSGKVMFRLMDIKGALIEFKELQVTAAQKVQFNFNRTSLLPRGVYIVEYGDSQRRAVIKVVKQ